MFSIRTKALVVALAWVCPASAADYLRYAGATTLQQHFMPKAAHSFHQETGIAFQISGGNTDPGLRALREGGIDIAGSGRFLTPQEREEGLHETLIGWDALLVLVHRENPVEDLTREQLRDIFSGTIRRWEELGGPAEPVLVVNAPEGSGMRAAVREMVMGQKRFTPREIVVPLVSDLDRQVAFLPGAICIVSRSFVDAPDIHFLRVGGVLPTQETVGSGAYPLVKPLVLVTRGEPAGPIARFLDLAQGEQGRKILTESFYLPQ